MSAGSAELINSVNRLISQPNGLIRNHDFLVRELTIFNDQFADPLKDTGPDLDEMKPLFTTLDMQLPVDLELLIARMLKILLRKSANRDGVGKFGIKCIIRSLLRYAYLSNNFHWINFYLYYFLILSGFRLLFYLIYWLLFLYLFVHSCIDKLKK